MHTLSTDGTASSPREPLATESSPEQPDERANAVEQVRQIVKEVLDSRLTALEDRLRAGERPVRANVMITERELAQMLRCDPRTIRRLEVSGDLPRALRVGGSKRWRLDVIEAWLDTLSREGRR